MTDDEKVKIVVDALRLGNRINQIKRAGLALVASAAAFVAVALAVENYRLRAESERQARQYEDILNTKLHGQRLGDLVKTGSLGVFKGKHGDVVCAVAR